MLRKVTGASRAALLPYYSDLVPSVCAIAQQTAGPTRLAAEQTLACVLQLDTGLGTCQEWLGSNTAGGLAVSMLTETTLRRLSRLQLADDDDEHS